MASTKEISAKYNEYISKAVIDKFGGSYVNYQTLRNRWRREMEYRPEIEEFILQETKVFFRLLDICDYGNLNMMYKVSKEMADYLSAYMVRKSENSKRSQVKRQLIDELFLKSNNFVHKFKKSFKDRTIDTTDTQYVKRNPGIVALYASISQNHL